MDKLSGVLVGAILLLIGFSAVTAYSVWGGSRQPVVPAELPVLSQEDIGEEAELACIAMNDEGRVINGSGEAMWIRAEIRQQGHNSAEKQGSGAIAAVEKPDAGQLEEGVWLWEKDGYYYYSQPVKPGEQTKPLLRPDALEKNHGETELCVWAEGVQINWVSQQAEDGQQAFEQFSPREPVENYKGSFV